jgi:hypothetical protein
LPPSSFYCRAVVPNHDDFHRKWYGTSY